MAIYHVVMIDDRDWVTKQGDRHLSDPTPYMENEAHFGVDVPEKSNPVRLPAGYRLTKIVDEQTETVPWKYCKVVNYAVVEMDQAEKAERDAEIAAEKQEATAKRRLTEEESDIFKIIFKMVNKNRPENIKVTVAEAKAIVDSVIK